MVRNEKNPDDNVLNSELSEIARLLGEMSIGNFTVAMNDMIENSEHADIKSIGQSIGKIISEYSSQYARVEEYHESTMELAMGISECFQVMAEVRSGNLNARVSEETLSSSDELLANLGSAVNSTISDLQGHVERQQYAIQELSTPILQLWDNVLALPVIGTVDTRRSLEIMEKLLTEIVEKQTKYVIIDITGVEVVDTKTADQFIKIIKAAELLGTRCILTGIRPAVAQTIVEIGIDLGGISTVRNLKEGLVECFHHLSLQKRMEKTPEK